MAVDGFVFEHIGTSGGAITTAFTITGAAGLDGCGADTGELAIISIACVLSTGKLKLLRFEASRSSGTRQRCDACEHTGTCGDGITSTREADGPGAATAASDIICIAIASSNIGQVPAGS
jgi:hypothetical protein